jgi:hypothetical protein
MNQIHVRWSAYAPPAIDVTPGASWRRGLRRVGLAMMLGLALAVALPLLWLFGALTLLAMLGGVAVMLLWGMVRQALAPRGRSRQGHRISAADEH